MSSAAVGTHSGAGPLSLMSCVRESSPLQDIDLDIEKHVAPKKRFWNPKKWFKRKHKHQEDVAPVEVTDIGCNDALGSRTTSEVSVTENISKRKSASSMNQGLSVSHDSVFHSPHSGSDLDAHSSSSLCISQPHIEFRLQSELSERLRLRRGHGDTSEDDEGLPRSPCNSPTTTDGHHLLEKTAHKDLPTKSHSTCSDGSLLSVGSSEMDEDSSGLHSRHSSKLSLTEKGNADQQDLDLELGLSSSAPLNHSAAHHRVAVRPKRTHGAPRRKKGAQLTSALPVTPELNEDSSVRSITPEVILRDTSIEMRSSQQAFSESYFKCSSLPPGLAAPGSDANKLNRSKSNAGTKIQNHDHFMPLLEEKEEKNEKSFFDRLFPRKSGKKKKSRDESSSIDTFFEQSTTSVTTISSSKHYEAKTTVVRSGAASRQRIQPIEIPASPIESRKAPSELAHAHFSTSPVKVHHQTTVIPIEFTKPDSKMKLANLSSLQQRVLTLTEDDQPDCKSLIDFTQRVKPLLAKSHSFKATVEPAKPIVEVAKAASLEAIDEPVVHQTDYKLEFKKSEENFGTITISGPSHTAVVNVTEAKSASESNSGVSITKIHLKREIADSLVSSTMLPEFVSKQMRPIVIEKLERKFSQENLEIVDQSDSSPVSPPVTRYIKHEVKATPRKALLETPPKKLRARSISLDSLATAESADVEPKSDVEEIVVVRRKSLVNVKKDEEPELMKVFARRSLKLKDHDLLIDQVDNKENVVKEVKVAVQPQEVVVKLAPPPKEVVIKVAPVVEVAKEPLGETNEVVLRKTSNNNVNSNYFYQRSVSFNPPRKIIGMPLKMQSSFKEQRNTIEVSEKSEVILTDTTGGDEINKTQPKNFNQRKAEWEKRAQLAQMKNVP